MRYAARCVKMLPKKKSKKNNKIIIMINKETGQEVDPVEYGIDAEAIQRQAKQNLMTGNKEYKKLQDEYQRLDRRRDFVKINLTQTKMRHMENQEVDRLWMLEIEKRKSVRGISDLLRQKDRAEYDHWQELLAGLSFVMDMIDFTVADINELLNRNNIGIKLEKFKEIEAARGLAQQLTGDNLSHSKDWHAQMWMDESDRLWEYLKERCAIYRRKVDRIESKMKKTENKG